MKRLSVIIPAYQAEQTIMKCVDSILSNQLNLEVLVVNDGSKDGTEELCRELAGRDPRVCVWTKENAGPGAAREFALARASGEYITFVDADDYISEGLYDRLEQALMDEPDILEYGYVMEQLNGDVISYHPMRTQACADLECARHYAEQANTTNFLWNKIFRKTLFGQVVFPHLYAGEDAAVLAQLFGYARRYQTAAEAGYHYVMTPDSLCRRPFSVKKLDNLKAYHFIDEFYAAHTPELCVYSKHKLCSLAVLLYCECRNGPDKLRAVCAEMLAEYRLARKQLTTRQLLTMGSRNRRLMLGMFELSPKLCARVFRWR